MRQIGRWIEEHPRAAFLLGIGMVLTGIGMVFVASLSTIP